MQILNNLIFISRGGGGYSSFALTVATINHNTFEVFSGVILLVFAFLVQGCDADQISSQKSQANEMFASPEFQSMQEASREIAVQTQGALARGVSKKELHQALANEDETRFYQLVGISSGKAQSLNRRYLAAHQALIQRFPSLYETSQEKEASCQATPEQKADRFLANAESFSASTPNDKARPLFEGCKKIALGGCLIGCGALTPTVFLGTLCGYGCYCGFCEGDRDGVCI